jgi:hypothetical protein
MAKQIPHTRASERRALRRMGSDRRPSAVEPEASSAQRAAPPNTQLAKITTLLEAARLEVAGLVINDDTLRRSICDDLDAMLEALRATSVQVADKGLPDRPRKTR